LFFTEKEKVKDPGLLEVYFRLGPGKGKKKRKKTPIASKMRPRRRNRKGEVLAGLFS